MRLESLPPDGTASPGPMPLCVDCDGTLIHTDLLCESFLILLKTRFWLALRVPYWLIVHGKARTKLRIAALVSVDASLLPYSQPVLRYIERHRAAGHKIVLATASAQKFADAIASHLGCFDAVEATNERDLRHLAGARKADRLDTLFGAGGYEYVGHSGDDLAVWRHAGRIAAAHAPASVLRGAARLGPVNCVAPPAPSMLRAAVKVLRPHQWLKNTLIFIPLAMAHRLQDRALLLDALLAFLSFGCCASSVYVLNDMLDIEADRAHQSKRRRPFAAGTLTIPTGAVLMLACLLLSVALLLWLPALFGLTMAVYYATTLAYSFRLKRQVMVDIMLLSALYTIRILAGAAATAIVPSFWLLSFSVFIFLSLALSKRYAEMRALASRAKRSASGRGYSVDDLPVLLALGTASGVGAVQVLALYINSPEVKHLYLHPKLLWIIMPLLLYWIGRVWIKTHRGEMHDDPVVFAAKDWQSQVIGGAVVGVACAASVSLA